MAGYSQQTLAEIQKKALAGQALVKPDAQKSALYDYYKQNANVKVTGGLNASTVNGTLAKAQSGTALMTPTGEKAALYNSVLGGGKAPAPVNNIAAPSSFAPQGTQGVQAPISGLGPQGVQGVQQPVQSIAPTGPAGMMAPAAVANPNHNSNQSKPDFLGMTPDMITKMFDGMQGSGQQYYDPTKDPVYNSMMELSTKQADKAGLGAMETMNDRGILNSTVTSDRLGQIKQGASDAVISQIGQLSANFDNKQMANNQSQQALLNSILGAGQFQQSFGEDNRRYDTDLTEDARRFDKNFGLDEAKVTGRYVPENAQAAINDILTAKEASAKGGITPEQRAANNAKASEARRLLATMGVDISGIDTNVGYSDAIKNASALGRNTLPQQEMDLAKTDVMGTQQNTTAQSLIDQVLRSKQASAKGGQTAEQKAYNAQTATNARNQLAALGYDVSGLAGNVGYDKALKNSTSLGAPTLKAKTEAANQQIEREKVAFERDAFGQELAFKKDSFGREMNYKEQMGLIDADLQSRGLDLEEVKIGISQFTAQSDAEYKQFQQDSGVSEQNASKNTNSAIGQVTRAKTPAEALEYIADSAESWAKQGVDIREVLNAVDKLFPGTKDAVVGGDSRYGTP